MHQPDTAEEKILFETGPIRESQSGSNPSYIDRFTLGAFWNLVSTIGAKLTAFIGAVIVARFLGKEGYGELAIIQSTIGMLGIFAGFGIGGTAIKYVAELRFKDPERAGRIIGLTYLVSWTAGGLMALGCFLAAPWVATRTINAPHLAPEIRLASLLLFVSAGFGPQTGILSGFQAFRALAKINWWTPLLSLPVTVALVWLAGLRGVILSLIFTALFGAALASLALRREYRSSGIRPNFREAWYDRYVLWRFSLPTFLANISYSPVLWAANALLANQPRGYSELGVFNACMQFKWMITGINSVLAAVSLPILSEIYGQNDEGRFARAINLNLRLNWGLAITLGFLILGFSPWLIQLFGDKFKSGSPVMGLVICSIVVDVACGIVGQTLFSSGRTWYSLGIHLLWGAFLLSAGLMLVPAYGALGLAAAFIISYSMILIGQLLLVSNLFGRTATSNIIPSVIFCCLLILCGLFSVTHITSYLFNIVLIILALLNCTVLINYNIAIFKNIFHNYASTAALKLGRNYGGRKS